jgi:hypothetical protein
MHIPKSYRYYKLEDLAAIVGISNEETPNLLGSVPNLQPSETLNAILERNMLIPMKNEKAKSELIVMPILVELFYVNQRFKPFSGLTFNIDKTKGLKGVCDFLISGKARVADLESPVVCVYEAKDDNIENWYGQCGAEMYAARLFNAQKGNDTLVIHGAVTNGFTWQFLKLEGQTLYIDSNRYGLANLPQLLGAIQKVYDFYK